MTERAWLSNLRLLWRTRKVDEFTVNTPSRLTVRLVVGPTSPFAEALDYLWGELTPEQVRDLPPEVKRACQDNHNALHHPPGWDHPHRFADPSNQESR